MWILSAFGSVLFAGLTAILAKCGIRKTDSTVATAIRTIVVLVMSWIMVFVTGKRGELKRVPRNELGFICLSGLATGGSWLCYYKALQDGRCKQGSAHRQAEYPCDHRVLLLCIPRKADEKIGTGVDACRWRYAADAGLTSVCPLFIWRYRKGTPSQRWRCKTAWTSRPSAVCCLSGEYPAAARYHE